MNVLYLTNRLMQKCFGFKHGLCTSRSYAKI